VATGEQLHRLMGYWDVAIAFSPDGKQLASAGRGGAILWNVATGEQLHRLIGYGDVATAIAFSPDGKQLALAERDGAILWDMATGEQLYRFMGYGDVAIAFSPDGKQLASAGRGGAILWDVATGEQLHRLRSYRDVAIAFSPNGKQLASAGRGGAILWDTATGEQLHRLTGYGDVAIAFSPNGKQLASAGEDGAILWDTATGKRLHRLRSYGDVATAVVFPSDGKQLPLISTNLATSSTATASTLAKMTPSGTNKMPYHLDDTKDIGKIDFSHDAGKPIAQVRNALSYVGGGQHTVNIYVDWQLPEFVRDGLDKTQDLATVLTITGEPDEAYVCSCEDYVKLAWRNNTCIAEFFRAFAASELISAKARKYHLSKFNRH
jgi:WD40 repeat protein